MGGGGTTLDYEQPRKVVVREGRMGGGEGRRGGQGRGREGRG